MSTKIDPRWPHLTLSYRQANIIARIVSNGGVYETRGTRPERGHTGYRLAASGLTLQASSVLALIKKGILVPNNDALLDNDTRSWRVAS